MTEPTLAGLAEAIEMLSNDVRQIKAWLVGNGAPGVFGDIRELRRDINANAAAETSAATAAAMAAVRATSEQRGRNGTVWQRLAFDVARNLMTVVLISLGGWAFATFVIGLRVTAGH